jgi:hypothetical protein
MPDMDWVLGVTLADIPGCTAAAWPTGVQVAFFLPQLVQQLRDDKGGQVEHFLLHAASRSVLFAHLLLCALKVVLVPDPEPSIALATPASPSELACQDCSSQLRHLHSVSQLPASKTCPC